LTTYVTKVHVFLILIFKSSKKIAPFGFFEANVPIIYLGRGDPKSCVFRRKKISTNYVTKAHVFLVVICNLSKNSTVWFFWKWMGPFIYLGLGVLESFVFRKIFFDNFCNESLWVSYYDLHVRKKISTFGFLETNGPNHLFRPGRSQKLSC
jgi:hypothetical protein